MVSRKLRRTLSSPESTGTTSEAWRRLSCPKFAKQLDDYADTRYFDNFEEKEPWWLPENEIKRQINYKEDNYNDYLFFDFAHKVNFNSQHDTFIESYIASLPEIIKEKYEERHSKDDSLLTFIEDDYRNLFATQGSDKQVLKNRRKQNNKVYISKISPGKTRPLISYLKEKKKSSQMLLMSQKSKVSEKSLLKGFLKGTNGSFFKTQVEKQFKNSTNGSHSDSMEHKKTVVINFENKKASSPLTESQRAWNQNHHKPPESKDAVRSTTKLYPTRTKDLKKDANVSRQKIEFNIPKLMIHMQCYQSPVKAEKADFQIYTNLMNAKANINFSASPRRQTVTAFPKIKQSILKHIFPNEQTFGGSPYSKQIFESRPTKGKFS
jgi:hypothetical protein